MQIKTALFLMLAATVLVTGTARAAAKPDDDRPALHITILEPVSMNAGSAFTDFDQLDLGFRYVAKQRNWPVKIAAERLAGGVPDYDPEVRVVLQPVRLEPAEYVFRAWTSVMIHGEMHDFGVVTFRYSIRLGESSNTTYEKIFRGAAGAIGDKIGPLLFPDLKKKP